MGMPAKQNHSNTLVSITIKVVKVLSIILLKLKQNLIQFTIIYRAYMCQVYIYILCQV